MDRYWGARKTSADYVKSVRLESAWPSNSDSTAGTTVSANNYTPWAAAVKSPPEQPMANNFNFNKGKIGSWNSPETSSSGSSSASVRAIGQNNCTTGSWNQEHLSKTNNYWAFDDGTAIWGSPTSKKAGIDWTEKESSTSSTQTQVTNISEKCILKPEQTESIAAAADYSASAEPPRGLLKEMVYQIQLAVQAGYLSADILNRPMSPSTVQLVYQLLSQFKTLKQFEDIQQHAGIKSDLSSPSNIDLQMNRIRQNISVLQKTINQEQAALTKNENLVDSPQIKQHQIQQQQANNYSYANISKLSTNSKVPSNMSSIISNSNMDSFRRSSLIDTLSNSNSDPLRSAQATYDANATIDETLSSLIQASSTNNFIGNIKTITTSGDFSKDHNFASGIVGQQQNSKRLLSAQPSSSSSSAWSAFSSGDFVSQQAWPSRLRISSNSSTTDHQNQYSAFDMVPDFGPGKAWHGSSILSDVKDKSTTNINTNNTMLPSGNMNVSRPDSASNALKQLNENSNLNADASLFCDWNNESDSTKGNFDQAFSSSSISGLSLQSNRWMFCPNSSSLNLGSGIDNISGKNNASGVNLNISHKLDNGNMDKMAGESLLFKTTNNTSSIQRSTSALYDWSDLASSTLQFNADPNSLGKQQATSSTSPSQRGRPAPPPGLISNLQWQSQLQPGHGRAEL